ncbi:MAG TPA: carbonic anhydrase [Candidatus Acidoferrales bacterium]|nr:carbonic anhydrase [Candidatus Acidoferrales bacterium]
MLVLTGPNEIIGLMPMEVFVHRNVANVVAHGDHQFSDRRQFAVEALKVRNVLVVGRYGCVGVRAALENARLGLVDNWLRASTMSSRSFSTRSKQLPTRGTSRYPM